HDRAVHGEQLVVGLVVHQLHARVHQLGPDQQRHDTGEQEERERGDQVHVPDHLVIGCRQPADDFRARGGPPSCGGCPDGRRRSLNRRRHLLTILFFSRGRGIVSRGRGVGGVLGGRGRARVGSRSLLLKVGNRGQLL